MIVALSPQKSLGRPTGVDTPACALHMLSTPKFNLRFIRSVRLSRGIDSAYLHTLIHRLLWMENERINSPASNPVTNSNPDQNQAAVIGDFTPDQVAKLVQYLSQEGKDQLTQWENAENPQYKAFLANDLLPKLQAAHQAKLGQEAIQHQTDALLTAYRAGDLDLLALTSKDFRILSNAVPSEKFREDLQSEKALQLAADSNRMLKAFLLYHSRPNNIRNLFPLRGMDEIYDALATDHNPLTGQPPNGWLRATLWRVFRKHV